VTSNTAQQDAAVTDKTRLATSAYADERHLAARQSIYQWQQPRYDLPRIVVEQLTGISGTVLDVGCGNGKFVTRLHHDRPELRIIGMDISAGILAVVPRPVVVADAQALPFADASVDAVLAMHMLYHVPDIPAAISELARILKPGGLVIASTNSDGDKRELDELWSQAAADVLGQEDGPSRVSLSARFSLEQAPDLLRSGFDEIQVIELPGTIELNDPAPVIAHLASYEAWADQLGVPFDATLRRAEELAMRKIAEEGAIRISCWGASCSVRRDKHHGPWTSTPHSFGSWPNWKTRAHVVSGTVAAMTLRP
jgi:ubiquinone/menaquinone biosynthesis C-methylase UbiE